MIGTDPPHAVLLKEIIRGSRTLARAISGSSACTDDPVRGQEVDHLPPSIRGRLRVVAEPHPEHRAIGQAHVERMGAYGYTTNFKSSAEAGRARCIISSQKWTGVTVSARPMSTSKGA